ncbi:hypothetical protein ACFVX6_34720 [Streptomyces sp. NPDC058289]
MEPRTTGGATRMEPRTTGGADRPPGVAASTEPRTTGGATRMLRATA